MIIIEPANLPATLGALSRKAVSLPKRELSSFLALAAEAAGIEGQISVLLTDDETIRELNRTYRKMDKATDVLSFPAAEPVKATGRKREVPAGDIAISLTTAARQAEAFGHDLKTEVKVLLLHGTLHLSGLDHETDRGQMARRERALRKQFDLPLGLIQRSAKAAVAKPSGRKKSVAKPIAKAKRRAKR
jgi:probable rRNA maturation factor